MGPLFLWTADAVAQGHCVCAKMPVFQNSAGDWVHYALLYDVVGGACSINSTPTQVVNSAKLPTQNCGAPTPCGSCGGLGGGSTAPFDVHVGDSKIQEFENLDETSEVRSYLSGLLTSCSNCFDTSHYNNPQKVVIKPPGGDPFCAVVWEVTRDTNPGFVAYFGVQLKDAPTPAESSSSLKPSQAVHHFRQQGQMKNAPINGMVRVDLHEHTAGADQKIAFVVLSTGTATGPGFAALSADESTRTAEAMSTAEGAPSVTGDTCCNPSTTAAPTPNCCDRGTVEQANCCTPVRCMPVRRCWWRRRF